MRKLVKLLMSVAAGLETSLTTYEQLNEPCDPPPVYEKLGFVARPSEDAVFIQPKPSPWINEEE